MLFVEDIDPSVGRFRNLVQTTVIPKKVHMLQTQYEVIFNGTLSNSRTTDNCLQTCVPARNGSATEQAAV